LPGSRAKLSLRLSVSPSPTQNLTTRRDRMHEGRTLGLNLVDVQERDAWIQSRQQLAREGGLSRAVGTSYYNGFRHSKIRSSPRLASSAQRYRVQRRDAARSAATRGWAEGSRRASHSSVLGIATRTCTKCDRLFRGLTFHG
jgi:hypothetical protein